jgi:hypothetical protein
MLLEGRFDRGTQTFDDRGRLRPGQFGEVPEVISNAFDKV